MLAGLWDAIETAGGTPSANLVIDFARRLNCKLRQNDARAFLRSRLEQRVATASATGPVAVPEIPHAGPDPVPVGSRSGPDFAGARADLKGLSLNRDTDVGEAKASPTTVVRARSKSARVRPTPHPLPDLPGVVAYDVVRLIGFDAAARRDGLVSQAKIDEGLRCLQRAFEKHGLEALIDGIEVAIVKGKGLAFAAGCVRNRGASSAPPRPSLFTRDDSQRAEDDVPPRYDDYEAPPEKIWTGGRA